MMRRNNVGLAADQNHNPMPGINQAAAIINNRVYRPNGVPNIDKNSLIRQRLQDTGSKPLSKYNAQDSPTTTSGYLLLLLSSVLLFTGWLGSWTSGGGGGGGPATTTTTPATTTHSSASTTTTFETPLNRSWKYECQYGYQGRHCDGNFH